jgi:pilus assembly protein Flp/PilA
MNMIKKLIANSKGATAIEYGLIAALIAVAGISAFQTVGDGIKGTFEEAGNELD